MNLQNVDSSISPVDDSSIGWLFLSSAMQDWNSELDGLFLVYVNQRNLFFKALSESFRVDMQKVQFQLLWHLG
jgi:hypothetical protein